MLKNKKNRVGKKTKKFVLEAKPLTEQQIKEFVAFYKQNGTFPGSKIPCNVTGKLTTCMGPWMLKKIKEFGSAENLLRNYKCRGAIKQEKIEAKPIKIRRPRLSRKEKKKIEIDEYNVPRFVEYKPIPIGPEDVKVITKDQCMRPDLFINNNRNCEGCPYFENCELHLKCLPKGVAFDGKNFVCSESTKKTKK